MLTKKKIDYIVSLENDLDAAERKIKEFEEILKSPDEKLLDAQREIEEYRKDQFTLINQQREDYTKNVEALKNEIDQLQEQKKTLMDMVSQIKKEEETIQNSTPSGTPQKNMIASTLKVASIVFFILAFIGAIGISQKEEIREIPDYDEDSYYSDEKYEAVKSFDGNTFSIIVAGSAISSLILYGFGELIQIEHDKKIKIYEIASKE